MAEWGIQGFVWCVSSGLDESYGVIAKVALVFFDPFMLMKIIIHGAFLLFSHAFQMSLLDWSDHNADLKAECLG